jgi:hypothetical protein
VLGDPDRERTVDWAFGPACSRCAQLTIVFGPKSAGSTQRKRAIVCDRCQAADHLKKIRPDPN